ncbi:hypothetical protein SPV3_ORF14 [Sulfolobus polyhedral virus 3]|nr:hypothetical protein SPV3_ORF14 [Sulfolobus polyhedral virus 3]
MSRQIAMLVPGVYECPGSGKYKTCEVLYEADPLQLPLWYDLSCVIETVNNAIIDASGCEEEGSFVQATGVQVRTLEGEMDYGPIVDLDLETRVICDNKDLTGILPPWVVT